MATQVPEKEKIDPREKARRERKASLLKKIEASKKADFEVKKIEVSNSDPVMNTVNRIKSILNS